MYASAVLTLELAGSTMEGGTTGRFVRSVAAVVLRVTAPPERDALVSGRTDELRRRTVADARLTVV